MLHATEGQYPKFRIRKPFVPQVVKTYERAHGNLTRSPTYLLPIYDQQEGLCWSNLMHTSLLLGMKVQAEVLSEQ